VFAPEAVRLVDEPTQMLGIAATAVTVGNGLTVRVTVAVPVQPAADVPVTVYVVVEPGVAVNDDPVPLGLHAYVFAPEAAIVEL